MRGPRLVSGALLCAGCRAAAAAAGRGGGRGPGAPPLPQRGEVQHIDNGGIPGIISFRGVLLAYNGGLGTPGFVPVSRCTNGGALDAPCDWKRRLVNITAVTPYDTARDPQMLGDDRTGLIWLAYGRDMTNKREKGTGAWKQRGGMPWPFASSPTPRLDVLAVVSRDLGLTWSAPRNITHPVGGEGWGWPASSGSTGVGHGIQHSSGRLLFPSYGADVLAPRNYPEVFYPHGNRSYPEWMMHSSSWMRYSDDGGTTWRNSQLFGAAPTFVSEKTTNGHCVEPEIVELYHPPGRLLANCRNQANLEHVCPNPGADTAVYAEGGCRVFFFSDDSGASWTNMTPMQALPDPACKSGTVRYPPAHALFLSNIPYARSFNASNRHDVHAYNPRVNLTLHASTDDGKTWPFRKLLWPEAQGVSGYSDLCITPKGAIGVHFVYGKGTAFMTVDPAAILAST